MKKTIIILFILIIGASSGYFMYFDSGNIIGATLWGLFISGILTLFTLLKITTTNSHNNNISTHMPMY